MTRSSVPTMSMGIMRTWTSTSTSQRRSAGSRQSKCGFLRRALMRRTSSNLRGRFGQPRNSACSRGRWRFGFRTAARGGRPSTLQASYNDLKANYDNLLREKVKLKAEVTWYLIDIRCHLLNSTMSHFELTIQHTIQLLNVVTFVELLI